MIFPHFSTFVGHFCPPESWPGSEFRIRIRVHWPDWIRILYGSGSATLLFSCPRAYSSPCAPHWSGGGPVYAPILPSRAYDHTPAPSPPPHLARRPATDHVAAGTVRISFLFPWGGGGQDSNRALNQWFWVSLCWYNSDSIGSEASCVKNRLTTIFFPTRGFLAALFARALRAPLMPEPGIEPGHPTMSSLESRWNNLKKCF